MKRDAEDNPRYDERRSGILVVAMVVALASGRVACACDTWLAMWDVTTSGDTILAKNSDRPTFDAQPLAFHPRQTWAPRAVVEAGRITIPQVQTTYATIGSSPYWCWGYEEGMNEFGVAIGNEGIKTRVLSRHLDELKSGQDPKLGLTGMDLLRLGLERGSTAEESLTVITSLLQKHGQFGSGMPNQDASEGGYDNSFVIADKNEAWVLETAGRQWVARRVKTGSTSISNTPTIRTQWDRSSPNLVATAVRAGWWPKNNREDFDFSAAYDDVGPAGKLWRSHALPRATCSSTLLRQRKGSIDTPWMMRIARDESSDPPINRDVTASSCVAVLPRSTDALPVFWWCPAVPKNSCYVPFFVHGSSLPKIVSTAGKQGTTVRPPSQVKADSFAANSVWWIFRDLHDRVSAAEDDQSTNVRMAFAKLEDDFAEELPAVIEKAISLRKSNQSEEASGVLDRFSAKCLERAIAEANRLRHSLARVRKPMLANKPTHGNVKYGTHERHVLDFWRAESEDPAPVLVSIHGGGFRKGNKSVIPKLRDACLNSGISVVAITYRLSQDAIAPAQFHDAARAIQFIRHNAKEWNIDPTRIAATGNSAGAGLSLWLGFHDDLADPDSRDPVLRHSSRLTCMAVSNGQSSYDPRFIRKLFPGDNSVYRHGALSNLFDVDLEDLDQLATEKYALFEEVSPIAHLTKDDVPALLTYLVKDSERDIGIHSPRFGHKLKNAMDELNIRSQVVTHLDRDDPRYARTVHDFIMEEFEKVSP